LFRFELERGEMANKIVIKNLRRQLSQVIVHKQVENGIAMNKNLNAY
jgi:glutamine cyclotransferase